MEAMRFIHLRFIHPVAGLVVWRRSATILYGAGSAMYNRISIPAEAVGGKKGDVVRYLELGKTVGFGSIQFSPDTINEIESIVQAKDGGHRFAIFLVRVSARGYGRCARAWRKWAYPRICCLGMELRASSMA